jgi:hypothetical protein
VDVRVIISQKTEIGVGFQFVLRFDENALEPTIVEEPETEAPDTEGSEAEESQADESDTEEAETEESRGGKLEYTSGNLFGTSESENVYVDSDEAGTIRYLAFLGMNGAVTVEDGAVVMTTTFKVKDTYHGKTGLTLSDALTFSGYDQINAVVTDANTVGYNGATIWSHEFGAATTTAATCTTPATFTCACTTAGCDVEPLVIETAPALGHTPGAEATCTTAQICTVCSAEVVPAKGHTPGAEATCTTAQVCTVCSVELAPAKGHTPETLAAKAATCTEDGLTEGSKCTTCNAVLTEQTKIAATGHTYGDWAVKKEATVTKEGVEERTCTVCGHVDQRAIPAEGLSPLAIVLIVVAVVVVLGGGGFCLYWFVFRKKRSA